VVLLVIEAAAFEFGRVINVLGRVVLVLLGWTVGRDEFDVLGLFAVLQGEQVMRAGQDYVAGDQTTRTVFDLLSDLEWDQPHSTERVLAHLFDLNSFTLLQFTPSEVDNP
jgi:hypothetical protein